MKLVNFSYKVIRTKRKNETRSQTVIHQFLNEEMHFVIPGCYLFALKIQCRYFSLQISVIFTKEDVMWSWQWNCFVSYMRYQFPFPSLIRHPVSFSKHSSVCVTHDQTERAVSWYSLAYSEKLWDRILTHGSLRL
jgi:hypothetical protein